MAEIVLRLCPGEGHPRTTAPRSLESFPISTVLGKDSIARIAPADTAIGRPTATARRLVNASVSDNTRRAYAGALGQRDGWPGGHRLDDAALAAYLAELHDAGCAASSAAMAVAAARFRAQAPRPPGGRLTCLAVHHFTLTTTGRRGRTSSVCASRS